MRIKSIRKLKMWLTIGTAAVLLAAMPLPAAAEVQYWTNSKDSQGTLIWTQPTYYPVGVIGTGLMEPDKDKPGGTKPSPMLSPKDVFVDRQDHIYVADTGNSRIVEFDETGKWQRFLTVPESPLNKPEGVFVTPGGDIYVADTGNKRVVRLTAEGKLVKEYKRPDSKIIPESFKYDPIKLVVDKRGFLYIATLGGYQGLLQLDSNGQFQSFYGANATELSPLDILKRRFYTKQMYNNEVSKLPGSISSVAADKDGFIYTTTSGNITTNQVKKLNISGLNLIAYDSDDGKKKKRTFGEMREKIYVSDQGYLKPQLIDLTIDKNGNITVIDDAFKIFSQYDANGNLLYFWGGASPDSSTQLGLMKKPVAIDANSRGDLIVLDAQEGTLQLFRLSEFGKLVNEANSLTLQGRYEDSEQLWREVLRYNAFFTPALLGLGKAAYKKGDYELAQKYFLEGGNRKGYSDAFWQIRLGWFQSHFSIFATTVLLGTVLLALSNRLTRNAGWRNAWRSRKRSKLPLLVQLKHMFTLIRHPIDGFTSLRYERKGSYPSALILLVLAFASLSFSQLYTGFIFNKSDPHRINLVMLFAEFALVWLGWVVSNYLVSAIFRGEGRFRDVFIASSYALFPMTIVGVPLAVISNVMTDSEQSIYNFLWQGMILWMVLLFLWKIMALQNYSVGETVVNIAYSAFAFVIMAVLIMIIFGLSSDLRSFIFEIYQEVRLR